MGAEAGLVKRKIGVFDSGVGGLSVANAIKRALPDCEVLFLNDSGHVPYGTRQPAEIWKFIVPIFDQFISEQCEAIVVACNTVSTTLIKDLRDRYDIPLIAMEPMIKPAASRSTSRVIAVCATPTTLKSGRYQELIELYGDGLKIIEPDCSDWSFMIEHHTIDERKIKLRIEEALQLNADVIVLACTHYHWIEKEIKLIAGTRAEVMQPEAATIAQLQRVLARL